MKDPKELEKEKKAREEEIAQLKTDIEAAGKQRDKLKAEYEKEPDAILKEEARLNCVVWNREIQRMKADLAQLETKHGQADSDPQAKRRIRSVFGR
jgi:hypothetical protein